MVLATEIMEVNMVLDVETGVIVLESSGSGGRSSCGGGGGGSGGGLGQVVESSGYVP